MVRGTLVPDGLAVLEVQASFLPGGQLSAKAAFVNTKTGRTHGYTEHTTWSPGTLAKLDELRALMEEDVAARHMEGYAPATKPGQVAPDPAASTTPFAGSSGGGLGEFYSNRSDADSM
jgi:hypothetical protein